MFLFNNDSNQTGHYYNYLANNELNELIDEVSPDSAPLEISLNFKLICTVLVVALGLFGHFLTILVYSKKLNRTNSSHVYMLCLALIDSSFLVVHIFEDTIPTAYSTYNASLDAVWFTDLLKLLNIVHKNDLACRFISYMRNVLRLVSAFLILVLTFQRFFIVYFPLHNRFKSKTSAWSTFMIICWIGFFTSSKYFV